MKSIDNATHMLTSIDKIMIMITVIIMIDIYDDYYYNHSIHLVPTWKEWSVKMQVPEWSPIIRACTNLITCVSVCVKDTTRTINNNRKRIWGETDIEYQKCKAFFIIVCHRSSKTRISSSSQKNSFNFAQITYEKSASSKAEVHFQV